MATGCPVAATFSIMFSASAVLPMLGRAARISISPF